MWYASTLASPGLVFTRRPSFIANIRVVCVYFGQTCYISGLEWLFQRFFTALLPSHRMRSSRLNWWATLHLISGAGRENHHTHRKSRPEHVGKCRIIQLDQIRKLVNIPDKQNIPPHRNYNETETNKQTFKTKLKQRSCKVATNLMRL